MCRDQPTNRPIDQQQQQMYAAQSSDNICTNCSTPITMFSVLGGGEEQRCWHLVIIMHLPKPKDLRVQLHLIENSINFNIQFANENRNAINDETIYAYICTYNICIYVCLYASVCVLVW